MPKFDLHTFNVNDVHVPDSQRLEALSLRTPERLAKRIAELGVQEYVIDTLIPAQGIAFVIGDSGLGKSPFLYQAAISVAAGLPDFLGRRIGRSGPVLMLDCENGQQQIDT